MELKLRTKKDITEYVDLMIEAGMKKAENRDQEIENEIKADCRAYLAATDYVLAKILEDMLDGKPLEDLKKENKTILKNRKTARSKVSS